MSLPLALLALFFSLPSVFSASFEVYASSECRSRLSYPEIDSFFSQPPLVEQCERSRHSRASFVNFTSAAIVDSASRFVRFSLYANESCSDASLQFSISSTLNSTASHYTCHPADLYSLDPHTGLFSSTRCWITIDLSVPPPPPPDTPTDDTTSGEVITPALLAALICAPILIAASVVAILYCCNRSAFRSHGSHRAGVDVVDDWYVVLSESLDDVAIGEEAVN